MNCEMTVLRWRSSIIFVDAEGMAALSLKVVGMCIAGLIFCAPRAGAIRIGGLDRCNVVGQPIGQVAQSRIAAPTARRLPT